MKFKSSFQKGLKPDPELSLLEWADKHFYLPQESTAEYGKYHSDRTPFVKEILEELSPTSSTQKVVLMKPTQLAGTTISIIFLCAIADAFPGPALMIMPTGDLAQGFSKKKITPTIKATPKLYGIFGENKSREKSNTILEKIFPGGSWRFAGSNSGAVYRSESIRYIILDDLDGFDLDIGGEGSPVLLADRRTGTFSNRKIYINSTPTIKDLSLIEIEYNDSSQGEFQVPCPFCNAYQYLVFRNLKFNAKNIDSDEIYYVCEYCEKRIDEHYKPDMLIGGKYVHKFPDHKTRGFRYNALYTPLGWVNDWRKIATEFLSSRKNSEKLKTWTNTLMAETFESEGDQPEWAQLKARCEPYQHLTMPQDAYLLSSGVDVQHNRLIVSIYAWGIGEECWLVYHTEIMGDVHTDDPWNQLDNLLTMQIGGYNIRSCGIDAGDGNTTQVVRNYCRKRQPIVFALKGMAQSGRPVISQPSKQDLTWRGEKITGGVDLWPIGSDTAKATLYNRLMQTKQGPGYVHFYIGIHDEYFMQLTAEKHVQRFVKGFPVQEWHKIRRRNDALDCWVYAYAAALRIGLAFLTNKQNNSISQNKVTSKQPLRRPGRPSWLSR